MKIRIVDIAKKAGVSTGTVDRIIHQRGKYSEASNEKVQKAIKELGYEPDILARNLALKKELYIVCLIPNPSDISYWQRPVAGIQKAISELGSFKVKVETILFSPRSEDFKEACQQVIQLNPNGVIYVPMFRNESLEFGNKLNKNNIPFIHINIYHPEINPLSYIGQNPIAAGKVAASLCNLSLKEKDNILIAYITKEKEEYSHQQDRIKGFIEFFNKRNSASVIKHLEVKIKTEAEDEINDQQLLEYLKLNPQVRIIYVPNSRAYRIAEILKRNAINNILLIGFDTIVKNIEYMRDGYINLLIGQQSKTQGYEAIMVLFNALFRKETVKKEHYLPIDILNNQNVDYYEGLLE